MTRRQQRLQDAISLLATLLPYGELRMSTDPEYALTEIYHRVVRREKQLKRVIKSARNSHKNFLDTQKDCWRLHELLEDATRWHPWPEENPPLGRYEVWAGRPFISDYDKVWGWADWTGGESITHWRELPPGPEENT